MRRYYDYDEDELLDMMETELEMEMEMIRAQQNNNNRNNDDIVSRLRGGRPNGRITLVKHLIATGIEVAQDIIKIVNNNNNNNGMVSKNHGTDNKVGKSLSESNNDAILIGTLIDTIYTDLKTIGLGNVYAKGDLLDIDNINFLLDFVDPNRGGTYITLHNNLINLKKLM